MLRRVTWPVLATLIVSAAVVLYAVALVYGELNQDEGWYLYAARMVGDGRIPYRDFAFTQGPVMPFVYALGCPLVSSMGIAGGRLLTFLFGAGAIACAVLLASGLVSESRRAAAAMAALALVGLNAYQAYFFTVVKTYALTSFLVGLGLLALLRALRGRWMLAAASAVCLVLAAGTRLSAAFMLPVLFVYLLMESRRAGWRPCVAFVAGGVLAAAVVFGPFLVLAPEGLWFGMVEYHGSRSAGGAVALLYKAGSVARLLQSYIVAAVVAVFVFAWRRAAVGARGEWTAEGRFAVAAGIALGLPALVHVAAPFPYDDYQTFLFPSAVALLASLLAGLLPERAEAQRLWVSAVALAALLGVAGAPALQNMFLAGQDRIWWRVRTTPQIVTLRHAAKAVRDLAGSDGLLLTQDLYLAVEAGLRVPIGLELGPFSYYPGFTTAKAARLRVLNTERMETLLSSCEARVSAFSGYGLAVESPTLKPIATPERERLLGIVESRYERALDLPGFGQAGTGLTVYRLRLGMEDGR